MWMNVLYAGIVCVFFIQKTRIYSPFFPQNLTFQESAQDVSCYIRNLLQTVNAIQFSHEIKLIGSGPGSTRRKTAIYKAMHAAESSSEAYQVWKRANEGKVKARNTLYLVYFAVSTYLDHVSLIETRQQFGFPMLLDPFWHPRNLEPNHRSPDFFETLEEVLKCIGPDYEDGISPLAEMLPSTRRALKTVLELFWPAASGHVLAFCDENTPNILIGSLGDSDE
ncbi:hypothetical protein B0H19DRAFT_24704 [Mycena capillaripes]|nr:hypothetical protein B0H19DRAFT_24704 [Mycena capillaripes]